ncbi:hypothetical protein NKR19_g9542 [Coniochaeta hoffmannii]|uniref:Uncharacterized protein n=1 Tax=Coniochaeta hoffmannii TaxID=91930 RepID=A0AA38RGP8_9PEZI|nr:hypothetical protein NKR19_g9542 [Coniochaeta hoffmannii]
MTANTDLNARSKPGPQRIGTTANDKSGDELASTTEKKTWTWANSSAHLAHRREQRRRSSRAKQQREIDERTCALKDENRQLRDAIQRIVRAAVFSPGDMADPDLQAAIQHAGQLANVNLNIDNNSSRTGSHAASSELDSWIRPRKTSASSTGPSDISSVDPSAMVVGPRSYWPRSDDSRQSYSSPSYQQEDLTNRSPAQPGLPPSSMIGPPGPTKTST